LKVRTTLDLDLQQAAQEAVNRNLGGGGPAAAVVVIDNESGEVRAMVGGRDYDARPFNLATQGRRQPGSAFKPFILAEALHQGIGPGSQWESRKRTFELSGRGDVFEVNNFEDSYAGTRTLASALTFSDNAVYAAVGIKAGTRKVARRARRMGIRTPISTNLAMTLGGLRQGVTPLDMAHAYQTLAAGGARVWGTLGADEKGPVGIRSVVKPNSESDVNARRRDQVLKRELAAVQRGIMATVVSQGSGRRASLGTEFAAGKTGTTENFGDAWFVGFTKRYTAAVWVGYPDKLRPMLTEYGGEPVAGGTFPAVIWRDFMLAANRINKAREERRRAKDGLPPQAVSTVPVPAVEPDAEAASEPDVETAPSTAPQVAPAPQTAPRRTPTPTPEVSRPAPTQRAPRPAPTPVPRPTLPAGGGDTGGASPGSG
jgi:penicillin-binding protein 1A